jgi:hypothetical protein
MYRHHREVHDRDLATAKRPNGKVDVVPAAGFEPAAFCSGASNAHALCSPAQTRWATALRVSGTGRVIRPLNGLADGARSAIIEPTGDAGPSIAANRCPRLVDAAPRRTDWHGGSAATGRVTSRLGLRRSVTNGELRADANTASRGHGPHSATGCGANRYDRQLPLAALDGLHDVQRWPWSAHPAFGDGEVAMDDQVGEQQGGLAQRTAGDRVPAGHDGEGDAAR